MLMENLIPVPAPTGRAVFRERFTRITAPAGISVWMVDLMSPVPEAELSWLSGDEWTRAKRFAHERDRRRSVAARTALRRVLSDAGQGDPARLIFRYNAWGKPCLDAPNAMAFNVTHSDELALIALGESVEIGIDLEMLRDLPDALDLAKEHFSAGERAILERLEARQRARSFLTGWTRKEAWVKAMGRGLHVDLAGLELGLEPSALVVESSGLRGMGSAELHSLDVPADAVAAVAWMTTRPEASDQAGQSGRVREVSGNRTLPTRSAGT